MRFCFFVLALGVALLAVPAEAASFDCAKARLPDERAVCSSRALSEMDVEMAVRYETLGGLVAMGTRGNMGDEQRAFLASRRRCGSAVPCLTALYRGRIAVLKDEYRELARRGPF